MLLKALASAQEQVQSSLVVALQRESSVPWFHLLVTNVILYIGAAVAHLCNRPANHVFRNPELFGEVPHFPVLVRRHKAAIRGYGRVSVWCHNALSGLRSKMMPPFYGRFWITVDVC